MKFYKKTIGDVVAMSAPAFRRARVFQAAGLGRRDSYHLAVAEATGVDLLITGDDDFERISTKKNLSVVRVINPLKVLLEVLL